MKESYYEIMIVGLQYRALEERTNKRKKKKLKIINQSHFSSINIEMIQSILTISKKSNMIEANNANHVK